MKYISPGIVFLALLLAACKKQSSRNIERLAETRTLNSLTACNYTVSTLAGTGMPGGMDGPGNVAQFVYPTGICMKQSLAYVTEPDEERIRSIATNGTTSTFVDLPWSLNGFISPTGICYEPVTNSFYVTDFHRILKVNAAGAVSIYAGHWQHGYIDHVSPGRARFNDPEGICTDNAGNLYVADRSNHCIRKISITTGQVTTLSGVGTVPGYMNGAGSTAKFNTPYGICFDAANSCLYVTDQFNNRIRKILMNGHTTPFAGSGLAGQDDGAQGIARFTNPYGIAVDLNGAVLVVQGSGKPLRKIYGGEVTTVIPDNGLGYTDGDASIAQFYHPKYIAVNSANQYLVTDWFNLVVRKVVCQ